jgi:hypothetical protein
MGTGVWWYLIFSCEDWRLLSLRGNASDIPFSENVFGVYSVRAARPQDEVRIFECTQKNFALRPCERLAGSWCTNRSSTHLGLNFNINKNIYGDDRNDN